MRSFETGEYRNIFKETGKSDDEIAKKIIESKYWEQVGLQRVEL